MTFKTHLGSAANNGASAAPFPPLELENRPAVGTDQAAYYLNREQQTLRGWACRDDGPLRPLRLNGRLAWRTEDLRRLLGVS